MKQDRNQRSKQRCQDLFWKVHNCIQSLFCSHTLCMNYITRMFLVVSCLVQSKQPIVFSAWSRPKKGTKA